MAWKSSGAPARVLRERQTGGQQPQLQSSVAQQLRDGSPFGIEQRLSAG